jgi:hypothetical protein
MVEGLGGDGEKFVYIASEDGCRKKDGISV